MPAAAHTSPGGTRHARHLQLVIAHLALTLACVSASVSYGAQNSAVPATQELRVGTLTGTMDACRARGSFPREHLYLSSLATRLERQLVWVCFTNKDALRQAVAAGLVDLAAAFLSPMSKSAGSQDDITFARPVANARSVVYAPPGPRIAAARHAYQRSFQHNSDQSKAADTVVYPHDTRARVLLGDLLARSVDQVHLSNDELDEATPLKQAQDRGLAAHLGPRAQSRRWALPGERNKLEDAVDQFLQARLATLQHLELLPDDLKGVSERGIIRVITRPERHGFYISSGRIRGFDHEFLLFFALANNLEIEYLVPHTDAQARMWLSSGVGDVWITSAAAANKDLESTAPYRRSELVLAGADSEPRKDGLLTVYSLPELLTARVRQQIARLYPQARIQPAEAAQTSLDLLIHVARNRDAIALVDKEHLRAAARIQVGVVRIGTFAEPRVRHWVTRRSSSLMRNKLAEYIRKEADGAFQRVLAQRYFARSKLRARADNTHQFSEFDATIRDAATKADIDWRLILALIWVESAFDPRAKSEKNAGGIMQIIPETRAELGLRDPNDPDASIRAGLRLLTMLRKRTPDFVSAPTRVWFAMAGYNAGWTKITRARKRAAEMGLDDARWFGHVEAAIRAESRNPPALSVNPCYCAETVRYLRRIRAQYSAYRHFMPAHADATDPNLLVQSARRQ